VNPIFQAISQVLSNLGPEHVFAAALFVLFAFMIYRGFTLEVPPRRRR
jgi:hypothetical protein